MFLREILKEMDELNCLRCGDELKTRAGFETGVCANCWDPKQDGEYDGSDDLFPDREEECEYMEYWVNPETNEILTEAAVRMFKKIGKKLVRKYRCTSGPKKGQPVSDPSKCATRKDPKKVRQGKKIARKGKSTRKRKSRITKKTSLSKMAARLNKGLKGNSSKTKKTVLKPSSTKFTKVSNASTSTVKTKVLSKTKKAKKNTKTK